LGGSRWLEKVTKLRAGLDRFRENQGSYAR
jgi:hypothetical protein